jgi:hypothetical protein
MALNSGREMVSYRFPLPKVSGSMALQLTEEALE